MLFEQPGIAGDLNMIAWSPDGSKLAAGYYSSQMVRCWSTGDWKAFKPLNGLTSGPSSVDWASDSSTLAVMAQVVMLFKPENGAYRVLEGATRASIETYAPYVRWSPDGSRLACFKGREVVIVETGSLKEVRRLRREGAKGVETVDFTWSPDSRQLLISWVVDGKPEQHIHDAETGEVAHSFAVASWHRNIEWLPDGRTVVINDSLLDIESQAVLGKFNRFHEWSEDGKVLLGRTDPQPVVDRFAKPGEKAQRVFSLTGIESPVSSPTVWSPNGKFVTTNRRVFVSSDATGSLRNVSDPTPNPV